MRYPFSVVLIVIITLSIAIRILYSGHAPGGIMSQDSYGYYASGERMFLTGIPGDDNRTPVYPFILAGIARLFGRQAQPEISSPPFLLAINALVVLQSIAGLGTLVFLHFLAKRTGLPAPVRAALLLVVGTNIMLIANERMILTEAFTGLWLVGTTFFLSLMTDRPTKKRFVVLTLLFVIGMFLKPMYILFPFATIPFLIWQRPTRAVWIGSVLTMVVFYCSVALYIRMNAGIYGYPGISHPGDISILGKILSLHLSVGAAKEEFPYFYESISDHYQRRGDPMPYRFLETYDPEIYTTGKDTLDRLPRFNRIVLLSSFPEYVAKSLVQIPAAMTQPNAVVILPDENHGPIARLFQALYRFNTTMQWLLPVILIGFPVALWNWIRKGFSAQKHYSNLILAAVVGLYQVLMSVFFSYGEYGRLISPALPLLYLTVMGFCTSIISVTKKTSIGAFPSRRLPKEYHSRE